MAIGQKFSYATISPIQGDPLGNALQDVEQNAFKYRAEKRLDDEAKAKKEKEALEDYTEWDGKFDPTIVGNSKIDDPMLSMAMKARDRADKIWRELKNPGLSFEQKAKLMSERNKIVQSFDVANQTPKMMIERIKQIAKDYDKYDQQDLNLLENITRQLETGKYEMNYDENGVARIKIYQTDESGKPVGVLKETTLADMVNEFQPTPKSTYKEDLLKYAKDYEVSKTVTGDYSGRVIEDQRVNRKPGSRDYNNAMEYAKVIISKPNERKIIARNNNLDPNNEQELLKFVTNDILNAIPDNYSNKPDADLAFRRSQARKDEEKPDFNIVETPPSYSQAKVKPGKGYKTVSITMKNQKPVSMISAFDFDDKGNQVRKEYSLATLNSYTVEVNKKGKRGIVAEITYPDIKTSSLTPSESSIFSKFKTNPDALTEEEQLAVSKITKGAQYKTEVVRLTEKDAVKFKNTVGAQNAQEMADLARVNETKPKIEY